ncbi:MAG TPA: ShlB/FhaC/HecB family hemolysin secretion/activation protein [Cyanobacteria bacterium UBA9273]|nr:ShlB/FhaC/HecB family hemolysin secretion/activation protein [Cyanobacteria bacterium UBA9273]
MLLDSAISTLLGRRFTPFYVGIACIGATSAILLESRYTVAASCCTNTLSHETSFQIQTPPVTPQTLPPNPNEDRFPQPSPSPEPLPPNSDPPIQPPPTPPSPTAPNSPTIQIQKINVTGSTVFGFDLIDPIVQSLQGRILTLEQLRQVADTITQLYLDRGYITSRAILVDQVITNGIVEIRIFEGVLEDIHIEGNRRVNPNYIKSRLQLGAGIPLNTAQLEDQLRLLRADPSFENVEASLRAGTQIGKSILIVRVTEAKSLTGSVSTDNSSSYSVGSERVGVNLRYRNLTGYGDEISTSYSRSTTGGSNTVELGYRIPFNPKNGTIQLQMTLDSNRVTAQPFAQFGIKGKSESYEISVRQPLVRTPREELALSFGFNFRNGQTFLFDNIPTRFGIGPNEEGVSRTSVIKFGQDYLQRDTKGAWALRSLFSLGTGWFDATINPDPIPDGRFFSWLAQVQRVQILGQDNTLLVGADLQLTPNSLLPSQQFVIGGGQSLRGYRQNTRVGDNGLRFFLEDRITLERNAAGIPIFQLTPFFDAGWVWNHPDNPNLLPSQRFLAAIGVGIIWQPLPKLSLELDYGFPLVELKDRGTNAQDEGFYFNVRYQF